MNPLVVLGATGSIGRQVLEVANRLEVPVAAIAARRGSDSLLEIARDVPDALVGVTSPSSEERERLSSELGNRVRWGNESLSELAALPGTTVLNGVVGSIGLAASVAALEAGNRLALANKESLIAGGPVVLAARERGGGDILPVDSEHSAVFQCLVGEETGAVLRVILTASGGPFLGWSLEQLAEVTPAEALRHPTWQMGPRITVDSATLMNKGFEVIEAHYLFGLDYDAIDVVIHPPSLVHALVEFADGSVKAHIGEPDMRVPIQYAITYPDRAPGPLPKFDLVGRELAFHPPDLDQLPALRLAYEAGKLGRSAPTVLNAADEVAVDAFLNGRLGFLGIAEVVERTMEGVEHRTVDSIDEVKSVDAEAREFAGSVLGRVC
ncbi:MAG: 1-deoxy-D-xylulose-5-phosphate reductoisomerase [Acidimicrobiia bacterium]